MTVSNNPCVNGMLNCTDTIGQVITGMTSNVTGSLFITFLIIILLFMAVAIMFGIRMEYTAIIIFPLILAFMIVSKDFMAFGAILLIYIAIIATANFFLK